MVAIEALRACGMRSRAWGVVAERPERGERRWSRGERVIDGEWAAREKKASPERHDARKGVGRIARAMGACGDNRYLWVVRKRYSEVRYWGDQRE